MKSFRIACSFAAFVLLLGIAAAQSRPPANRSGLRGPEDAHSLLFVPAVSIDSGGASAKSVAIGDVNGDGKPDVIVANQCQTVTNCDGPGEVSVLLGNGDGTFQAPLTYLSGGLVASAVAIADVNRDGHPDVVVTNGCQTLNSGGNCFGQAGVVGVLIGNGNGTFQTAVTYPSGARQALSLAIGDLNRDGRPDLVVGNYDYSDQDSTQIVSVLLNKGDGTFLPAVLYQSGGPIAYSVAVADVNADGKLDLIVANYCLDFCQGGDTPGGGVSVLLGNGKGAFQSPLSYGSGGAYASGVVAADINRDGHLDLVVANTCSDSRCSADGGVVGVLLGHGDGTFDLPFSFDSQGTWATAVAVTDVSGDGFADLLMMNFVSGTVAVLLDPVSGSFGQDGIYGTGGIAPYSIAVADVNGDGQPDVVLANGAGCNVNCVDGTVGVLFNNRNAPPTMTSLASNLHPADPKQLVTYTATASSQAGGTLTGTIAFTDQGATVATVALANNQATYTTSYTKNDVGAHTITATYGGALYQALGSISAPLTEYVRNTSTKTRVTTSGSPSHVGEPVTFTATVKAPYPKTIPDGESVTFSSAKTILGTSTTVSGVAQLTVSFSKAKTYTVKATYSGDNIFKPSSGTVQQVVNP